MSLYAWLMLASFLGPFLLSFDKKVSYYKKWPALMIGLLVNGALFISWDVWFTHSGIWAFNPDYVWPMRLFSLPIEEWAFFVVVPFASIFIYECIKRYLPHHFLQSRGKYLTVFFLLITASGSIAFHQKTYTVVNCTVCFFLLCIVFLRDRKRNETGSFWLAYFVHLLPFMVINGILTGSLTPEPVVIYNSDEIIGIRLFTIPIEDTIYALTCLLLPLTVMNEILEKFPSLKFR